MANTHFVEWNGNAVSSVKTGFATAVRIGPVRSQRDRALAGDRPRASPRQGAVRDVVGEQRPGATQGSIPLPTSDPRRPYNEAALAGDYNINDLPYQGGGDPDRRAAAQAVTVSGEVNGKTELVVKFEAGTSLSRLSRT